MKIRKIITLFLFLILMVNSTNIYAASEPKANDDSKTIIEWVRDNSDKVGDVPISKLLSWYKKCETDTSVMSKLQSALCNKSASSIEEFCNGKTADQIKNAVNNQKILSSWSEEVPVSKTDLKTKLTQATSSEKKENEGQKEEAKLESTVINPSDFDPTKSRNAIDDSAANKFAGKIIGGIRALGTIISVFAITIIGIKYMLGSVEERAEYKSIMIPYLIGAIFVFGCCNIVAAIYNAIY